MLATSEVIEAVAGALEALPGVPVVLDPVMVAASGDVLLDEDAIATLKSVLLPRAIVITPNLPEAAQLVGAPQASDEDEMRAQARQLKRLGAQAVLIKGGAVKIGMLATSEVIEAVAGALEALPGVPVVLDPVMVAASGDVLLDEDAIATLKSVLLPRAIVITPNLPEAAQLVGAPQASDEDEMRAQARQLKRLGAQAVLIKGGHAKGASSVDLLLDGEGEMRLEAPRVPTKNDHGTGCTLSSAIAAELAKGASLREAAAAAKAYVTAAIATADELEIGKGRGPVHHFHVVWPRK
jgi:hydroxymethylpyrimidine/phosphomethylpyrimidine kinase